MTQDELKLVLEALEEAQTTDDSMHKWDRNKKAITAIKQALAQTQEPVAWMDADGNVSDNNDHKCFPIPLYTHPPQTQEPDDIASILACRDMLDAQPVPPRTTG